MKLICRSLGRSRRGMILPTALVLTTLLFSLLAMTVSQGANRVQAWHELIANQEFDGSFLIAKQLIHQGKQQGQINLGYGRLAEWEYTQHKVFVTLRPSGFTQNRSLDKIY